MKINKALTQIQEDLKADGVEKNLHAVRIIVTDFDSITEKGRCYRDDKGKPIAIVLSHDILSQDSYDDDLLPWYFTVLLHEVGHCYFGREHETEMFPFEDKELVFSKSSAKAGVEHRLAWITPSVMNTNGDRMILKTLRTYYVKEIAGIDRVTSWEDFNRYTEVSLEDVEAFYIKPEITAHF